MTTQDYSAKGFFWTLLNVALVLVILFGLVGTGTMIRYSHSIAPSRTITVSGEGKTEVIPDIAYYSFSVVTRGQNLTKVQQENTAKMNKAIEFVKTQGVKSADIKTTAYNPGLVYAYDEKSGKQTVDGYELTQTVRIKIRDLGSVGVILNGLVESGVNQAGSLSYSIEDPEAQRGVARQEAFNNAFMKASQMAGQNGVKIARVINFSEYSNSPSPMYSAKASFVSAGAGRDVPNMEAGSEEVIINVSVTYEIR